MKFIVFEAQTGGYKKLTGEDLPDEINFNTLEELMEWVDKAGGSIVISYRTNNEFCHYITVYNGYLE